ncbi:MAG: hypothetical protein R6W72_00215 [Desulfurivibrionaceae bacterium]
MMKNRNRSAAPHLRTIGPAYVHGVRGDGPLVQKCTTAERLQSGGFGAFATPSLLMNSQKVENVMAKQKVR